MHAELLLERAYSKSHKHEKSPVFVAMAAILQVELDKERNRDLQKSNYSCMYYGNPGTGKVG